MKNKGFTLIELLAVIVILAIIALIATPIVLGIIEDSRNSAKLNSAQFILDGVQTAYAVSYTKTYEDDTTTTDVDESKASGEVPSLENIKAEVSFKNADVKIESGKLVVKANDGVTCEFTVTDKKLSSNDCGLTPDIETIEIGEVK